MGKHREIFNVNYFGVLNFVDEWIKGDFESKPHFIVTSSVNAIWAPPGGSAYAASKSAISKAFEGLSASFFGKAKFSSIYCGPIQTNGFKGKAPFVWSAQKMAKYMVEFAKRAKKRLYPSLFYYFICHILRCLPYSWTAKKFGLKAENSDAK